MIIYSIDKLTDHVFQLPVNRSPVRIAALALQSLTVDTTAAAHRDTAVMTVKRVNTQLQPILFQLKYFPLLQT